MSGGTQTTRLFEETKSNTCSEELAQVLLGEFAESLEDMLLDLHRGFFELAWGEGDHGGGKVGAVDRVVHGYGDFKSRVIVNDAASDASPHRLEN